MTLGNPGVTVGIIASGYSLRRQSPSSTVYNVATSRTDQPEFTFNLNFGRQNVMPSLLR